MHFGKWDEVYISPSRQQEFIERLKQVNPGIMVK
ncbi:PH domain-containing protein [Rufibacter sp. LB8]